MAVLGRLLDHATSYFEELGVAKRAKRPTALRFSKTLVALRRSASRKLEMKVIGPQMPGS